MLALQRILACLLLACGVLVAGACAAMWSAPAHAQGRLEAHYLATLAGIQIGKGTWVVEIDNSHYSAATSGITTGLMHVITRGAGTSAVRGMLHAGKPTKSVYASTIVSRKKIDEVRLTIDNGDVKNDRVDPTPNPDKDRVPVTPAERHGVLDPLTASLVRVPGDGDLLGPQACDRTLPIFDGRLRYDLQLAFKRMDKVKAKKGYAGPVVVCAVYFSPLGGYNPSHKTIKYIAKLRDMEIWLAPIAGTRVLVPFRAQGPTPIGQAVLQATQFVSVPITNRAAADFDRLP